jgi:hypothetical protein
VAKSSKAPAEVGGFVVEEVENPQYRQNEIFPAYEDFRSPRIWELRERYGLEDVVAGEEDEAKRQLLLRNWLKHHITINDHYPTPTRGDAFGILDAALKGGGFHCGHFMVVQHAVMNAFGYVCRSLGAGPGEKDDGGHHGINEVWSNTYCKWYLSDAKYDIHFEKKARIPLSVLEIREEHQKNKGADVFRVRGPERKRVPVSSTEVEGRAATYNWPSWHTNTNSFTAWPNAGGSALVIYEDDYVRTHTWYRDGKPCWAYQADFFVPVRHRGWIEWTPNVVSVRVEVKPGPSNTKEPGYWAHAAIRSFTPNFKEYQVKVGGSEWHPVEAQFAVPLYSDVADSAKVARRATSAGNEFRVRSVNLFDVTGPEHLVRVRRAT